MTDGKYGEQLFSQLMKERGYEVEDVSGNPEYWPQDIDFIVHSPYSGLTKSMEVKWDGLINRTGNLYLELTNIHSKQWNGEGWWPHCKADYLVYGDAVSRTFYVIPLLALRERVEQLPQRHAKCGYDSTGLLVSLDDIKDLIKIL